MSYEVSYVIVGERGGGAIMTASEPPIPGMQITLGDRVFVVQEVIEVMRRGDFIFLQAAIAPLEKTQTEASS
jgi:hypothetical protein